MSEITHAMKANALRALAMDAVQQANSGHPGMPMGMADVATVLYEHFLKFDPSHPDWPDRDRFVLSAGHGSMLLYALNHLTGYAAMTLDQLKNFRQIGSLTAGHPEVDLAAGIETTTGPLGQGIATAVGMALGERLLNARFGDDLVDHRCWVIASDGDLMEGVSHEACSLAGHLGLGRLIVLYDDNGISIDGPTSLAYTEDVPARFDAYGWHTQRVDGHDEEAVRVAIEQALEDERPSLIACRTTIGFGAPNKAGTASVHGAPLGADEIAAAREQLGWPHPPFEIPEDIRAAWTAIGQRGMAGRQAWEDRLAAAPEGEAFRANWLDPRPPELRQRIAAHKKKISTERPKLATRKASQGVIDAISPGSVGLIGGSADLTGSNLTRAADCVDISGGDFGGSYVRYGVREHGMAAAMNGLALHSGLLPFGGTFLTFSDYARPSIRLAALMGVRAIHVMTHDSIGLGEDGPTHQPVEHYWALRAIPNLLFLRPCDAVETAECWEIALNADSTPSVLALTRQNLPTYRVEHTDVNQAALGGYILRSAGNIHKVTLIASGSEVEIAMQARDLLEAEGIGASVVSMPCVELFEAQDARYRAGILPEGTVRIAVEAGIRGSWDRLTGPQGGFVGMNGFGASGPYEALYEHFGITPANVAALARERLALG